MHEQHTCKRHTTGEHSLEEQFLAISREQEAQNTAILNGYLADMANLRQHLKSEIAKFKAEEERNYIIRIAREVAREEIQWHEYKKKKSERK